MEQTIDSLMNFTYFFGLGGEFPNYHLYNILPLFTMKLVGLLTPTG
jgi:hypothetical protein